MVVAGQNVDERAGQGTQLGRLIGGGGEGVHGVGELLPKLPVALPGLDDEVKELVEGESVIVGILRWGSTSPPGSAA